MYRCTLTKLVLNDNTPIDPGNLMVIIGPNNAGKSQALKDVAAIVTGSTKKPIVVKNVCWNLPDSIGDMRSSYDVERYQDQKGTWRFRTLDPNLVKEHQQTSFPSWPEGYEELFRNNPKSCFTTYFGSSLVSFLTTEHRLQLVQESASPSEAKQNATLLQHLYNCDKATELKIRKQVKRVFGREVALDYSVPQRLQLRVASEFDSLPGDPRDLRPIMTKSEKLDEQGDGIRAFVGLMVSMLSLKRPLFLIDEPELFLHPPQAFWAGHFIAETAGEERQVIVATHSVDILRGMLSVTSKVTIVRVDRIDEVNTFSRLDTDRLEELIVDPLLSAARVLDGLFYPGALVVEGDADARFYFAAAKKRDRSIDMHVVNAGHKQTVSRILQMYREMGVRCAGIVDFDVLNNSAELKKHLDLLHLPSSDQSEVVSVREEIAKAAGETPADARLETLRTRLVGLADQVLSIQNKSFSSEADSLTAKEKFLRTVESRLHELADATKNWNRLKKEGRSALGPQLQADFDRLHTVCAKSGLFVNPCGELESTLSEVGIPWSSDKKEWIRRALELLKNLEVDDKKYPWKLVKGVQEYLAHSKPSGTATSVAASCQLDSASFPISDATGV